MLIFFGILFLIVAIIILTVKYLKIHAQELSKDSFEKAAKDRAKKLEYEDPDITCDYCGNKIDNSKYRECPVCGGTYDSNPEWIKRHNPDLLWADATADSYAKSRLAEVERKSAPVARKLKMAVLILSGIIAFILLVCLVVWLVTPPHYYRQDETVNQYSYDAYIKENYGAIGDGVILDQDGVKITLTGIYKDSEGVGQGLKMEYLVENTRDEDVRICFELFGVNGYCREGSLGIEYDWYKKNSVTTIYDSLYAMGETDVINSLVYGHMYLENEDGTFYRNEDLITIRTNAEKDGMIRMSDGNTIFEQNGVEIQLMTGSSGYVFWIENDTDHDYRISSTDLRIDGQEYDSSSIYRSMLPAHHVFRSDDVYVYNVVDTQELGKGILDLQGKKIEISFEFDCEKNPEAGFQTGYIKLQ